MMTTQIFQSSAMTLVQSICTYLVHEVREVSVRQDEREKNIPPTSDDKQN